MKKKIGIGIIVVLAITYIVWIAWLHFGTRTIDLADYTYITFQGKSGEGIAILELDDRYFLDDMNVTASLDKSDNLSNGDTITIKYSYDKDSCHKYGVKIERDEVSYRVSELTDTKKSDHYFYAPDDMDDAVAGEFLNVISDEVTRDIRNTASIGTNNEYEVKDEQIVGVYYDPMSDATEVLYKASVTLGNRELYNQTIYALFSFDGIRVNADGTYYRLNDYNEKITENVFDSQYASHDLLGYQYYDISDTFFSSIFYATDRESIDGYYENKNYKFMEYEYKEREK